jgi:Tol biopolymer transport system component
MKKTLTRGSLVAGLVFTLALTVGLPSRADAQYFGRNKVQYDKFKFEVLTTEHFDIHYYPSEAEAAKQVARMAERWYARYSKMFGHTLNGRQPVILYASHPDFEQTNVIEGELGEGTGGVTEGAKRRVIMPMAASLADTDHVLGHELVHAFQYDILGPNVEGLPLWFIEGMAEYLSIGGRDPQTAMWLRDAALDDRLPTVKQLDDPRYFPYRFGHAFWAYIGGRYGDDMIARILLNLAPIGDSGGGMSRASARDAIETIEEAVGMSVDELSAAWHASVRETYGLTAMIRENRARGTTGATPGAPVIIGRKTGAGEMNVGPSLSPDGTRIAFLSSRDQLSIDLYLADATTGKIIKRLVETASDPHFESLQFLASAGAWDPKGTRLAVATVRSGKPVIAILDATNGHSQQEIKVQEVDEIFQPTWSPDGNRIAFSGQAGGFTDLYVLDVATATTKRLMSDAYSDLEPAWSPDGAKIAFVTDRFTTNLTQLSYGSPQLAQVVVSTGAIFKLETGLPGSAVNPQWSGDGNTLFFISDTGGRPNAYRMDLTTKQISPVTSEVTGVAGITPSSPALSVAQQASKAAVSVFRGGGHEIELIDTATVAPALTLPVSTTVDAAGLPPAKRVPSLVAEQLKQPTAGLPEAQDFPSQPYSPKLQLVGIGQAVGVSTGGAFGTYASGGIALQFADMLGEHLLGISFGVDGGLKDIATSVNYLNRASRWNWGVFGERIPFVAGAVTSGFANSNGQTVFVEQTQFYRQTNQQGGMVVAYPLSRVTRLELSGAARYITFDNEVRTRIFDPVSGALLSDQKVDLPTSDNLKLFDGGIALVRDTSVFGATSPIKGARARLDYSPMAGDLTFSTVTLDYRRYFMPLRPITFAVRGIHIGRYGGSAEDPRLAPMTIGYSTLVRGYDIYSFDSSDCTFTLTGACPEYERLFGSRVMVFNAEVRSPLAGLFNRQLDYGPVPVEVFGFFDSGVAWTQAERPDFVSNGTRPWVRSAGFGARVNVFGFAVAEFNAAHPFDRLGKGWTFVFNLRPGF